LPHRPPVGWPLTDMVLPTFVSQSPQGAPAPCRLACFGGRCWVRTSDLLGVNEARFHCANRPRGGGGNRTRVQGFAGPCLSHSATPPAPTFPAGGIMALDIRRTVRAWGLRDGIRRLRADDGIRTRDPHLGKVMLYQLSHVRMWCTPIRARSPGQVCVQNCSRSWAPSKLGPVARRRPMRAGRYSARRAFATLRRAAR
jgi:hypothetical protein